MIPLSKSPLLLSLIALLTSCAPPTQRATAPLPAPQKPSAPIRGIPQPQATPPPAPRVAQKKATLPSTNTPPTPSAKHPLKVRSVIYNGTTFTAVTFDRRDYTLKVIDQKAGPGSEFTSAIQAGQSHKSNLATINGGFFDPDGKPIGLVITNGESRGAFNSTSFLGIGILDAKALTLTTRGSYKKSSELLQTGPRLLWPNTTLTGLSTKKDRPRSFLIWDGKNHFGIVHASSATLQGLSNNLKSQPLAGFKITHALNLDGGSSSDLWVSSTVPGGGFSKRSFLNKNVRNYLALQKR